MSRMFVYGTLKSDGPLAQQMLDSGCSIVHPFAILRNHRMVDMGKYPGIITEQPQVSFRQTVILGEVWEVPEDIRRQIDAMEVGAGYVSGSAQVEFLDSEAQVLGQEILEPNYTRMTACSYYRIPSGHVDSFAGQVPTSYVDEMFFRENGINYMEGEYREVNVHKWTCGNYPRRENGNYSNGNPITHWIVNKLDEDTLQRMRDRDSQSGEADQEYEDDE